MSKKASKLNFADARRNAILEERLHIESALRRDAEARLEQARAAAPAPAAPPPAAAPPPPPPVKTRREQVAELSAAGRHLEARMLVLSDPRGYAQEADARVAAERAARGGR